MEGIKWCLSLKNGIELIEPNENLKKAYFIKAEESLDTLRLSKAKSWKATTAYYTIYFSLYAILMDIGIKSEIHRCTINFAKKFLKKYFSEEDFELIDIAFSSRIDLQYNVNKDVPDKKFNLIIKKAPLFLVKCKNMIIKKEDINEIRKKVLLL